MKSNRSILVLATLGLAIVSASAPALDPDADFSKLLHPAGEVVSPDAPSGPPMLSDACPATDLGTISGSAQVIGSTAGSADDFDASAWGCGDHAGGQDEIFQFTVDASGFWELSTCDTATFDTSIGLYTETGGGCPGDFLDCNGDGTGCAGFTSLLQIGLTSGTTYYVVVDGWSTSTYGDFELNITNVSCANNADCDDGDICNGTEVCDVGTGACQPGPPVCQPFQTCDPITQECVDPDPCVTWRGGEAGPFYFPHAFNCVTPNWLLEDIQTSKHTSGVLDHYVVPIIARSTPPGASPLGTVYDVELALWTVIGDGSCNPDRIITGSECTESGTVQVAGSPPDLLTCVRPVELPNNDGDFIRCEIDFFLGYRTGEQGAGIQWPDSQESIGGPAATDEFGMDQIWFEDCPGTGQFGPIYCRGGCGVIFDFAGVEICQKPLGTCCTVEGGCSQMVENDCMGTWGVQTGTVSDGPPSCEGDADGDGIDGICGDNCPDDANPLQEDCDGDGIGDACEDASDQDQDGDGICNGDDNCPNTPNPLQEDIDGDGVGDVCDNCPFTPNPDQFDCDLDGVGYVCDLCPCDTSGDSDGDGITDGCDHCPGIDDNSPGALEDDDDDGVANCVDQCPGVDDAIFAPECEGAIPATSEWGLVILALLILTAGKVYFGRRESLA